MLASEEHLRRRRRRHGSRDPSLSPLHWRENRGLLPTPPPLSIDSRVLRLATTVARSLPRTHC